MSKVYFTSLYAASKEENVPNKLRKLYERSEFKSLMAPKEQTAVKLHFGEKGNTTYVHPVFVRAIVDKVKESGCKPFLTDTNTLYSGSRTNSVDHIQTAIENGFDFAVTGAPIIISDGLYSKNFVEVEIDCKNFSYAKIAGDIYYADSMIVISHFKGHGMAGFGGAIKNLAMGGASAAGKQMQHSSIKPEVQEERCICCMKCKLVCPVKAISSQENKKAHIDHDICYGCGECTTVCPVKAIDVNWTTDNNEFLEKMAEFALGAVKNKMEKTGYISFLMNVTPHCDCAAWSDRPIVSDIGILASKDPVALDTACYDLIVRQAGEDVIAKIYPDIDARYLLAYAQKIGLGSTAYELVEL